MDVSRVPAQIVANIVFKQAVEIEMLREQLSQARQELGEMRKKQEGKDNDASNP